MLSPDLVLFLSELRGETEVYSLGRNAEGHARVFPCLFTPLGVISKSILLDVMWMDTLGPDHFSESSISVTVTPPGFPNTHI